MPFYHRAGNLPRVKHTTFYRADNAGLHREELVSSRGFSGAYSTKYHLAMPTAVLQARAIEGPRDEPWTDAGLAPMHLQTGAVERTGDFIDARAVLLQNAHCRISTARVTRAGEAFYRNAAASEYLFIHHGRGALTSEYGRLSFEPGDQILVPKATTYRMDFESFDDVKLLVVESNAAIEIPAHYRNGVGQLTEDAPYSERDLRLPEFVTPSDERGAFRLVLRSGERWFEQTLAHHPFDVVGWDGYLYPFAFNMRDFNPKVGRIHLPPPVHLAFRSAEFVICNFVPRPYDFHPEAVPAPYFHSNIDSDEVLYYCGGEFMSRKGVSEGSITLHPAGMPHGPQPGRTEASVGAAATFEWAVMIDTFSPLHPTVRAREALDAEYPRSWLTDDDLRE